MIPFITRRSPFSRTSRRPGRTYSPDLLPQLQSLLLTLADIDSEFRTKLETVQQSAADEPLKQRAIATLKTRYHERRTPYVRELNKLETEIQQMIG